MGVLLEARGLRKAFRTTLAVKHVDMTIEEGEVHALIGPNGAGKSTVINMLAGHLRPTAGSIMLRGRDVTRLPQWARARAGIGRTFQTTSLFDNLTVEQNLRIAVQGRRPLIGLSPAGMVHVEEEVRRLLDLVGLSAWAHRYPPQMSHGDQRRLEIALGLATRPLLLLLDEPTAGMSVPETNEMVELLQSILRKEGTTILIVEHDMSVIMRLANRITVLDRGEVIASGSPEAITRDERVQEAYLGRRWAQYVAGAGA